MLLATRPGRHTVIGSLGADAICICNTITVMTIRLLYRLAISRMLDRSLVAVTLCLIAHWRYIGWFDIPTTSVLIHTRYFIIVSLHLRRLLQCLDAISTASIFTSRGQIIYTTPPSFLRPFIIVHTIPWIASATTCSRCSKRQSFTHIGNTVPDSLSDIHKRFTGICYDHCDLFFGRSGNILGEINCSHNTIFSCVTHTRQQICGGLKACV